ncbi:DNA glycosylase AlkZ-like family protein, partial [Aeromonas dhakensis]
FARHLVERYLAAQGFGSLRQMGYLRRNVQAPIKAALAAMEEEGRLESFAVGRERYWFESDLAAPTGVPNRVWLLNP